MRYQLEMGIPFVSLLDSGINRTTIDVATVTVRFVHGKCI